MTSPYRVGEVLFAQTKLRKGNPQPGRKYHFCICNINRLYLFICSDKRKYDYEISNSDCAKLPNPVSYISLNGLKHVPDDVMRTSAPDLTCIVSRAYLRKFYDYVAVTPVLSDKDRRTILAGLLPAI